MKKTVILILIVILLVTFLFGCSNKNNTNVEPDTLTTEINTTSLDDFSEIEETDSASFSVNTPFLLNDYIYYFDDAYFEDGEFSFDDICYNSLYRTNKNGEGREKIYSGKDIGVYCFGFKYSVGDYIYIEENRNSDKSKKVSKISLSTGKSTALFEDVLNDKNTVFPYGNGIGIYNNGLFYLKKNDAKSELTQTELWYASADGKTDFICDAVKGYYIVGNRLFVNTSNGEKAFNANAPYKEIPTFMFEMETPISTDNTGTFSVGFRSNNDDKSELYKYDIYSGDETILKTGFISDCEIVNDIIFFTEYEDGKCSVYQMNLNGENIKLLSRT